MCPYSRNEALKIIKDILRSGSILTTVHLRERMAERAFTMQDVIQVLKRGIILREPEMHPKTGNMVYTVKGRTIDGHVLTVALTIDETQKRLTILTGIMEG